VLRRLDHASAAVGYSEGRLEQHSREDGLQRSDDDEGEDAPTAS
jgi:hypothetical protein